MPECAVILCSLGTSDIPSPEYARQSLASDPRLSSVEILKGAAPTFLTRVISRSAPSGPEGASDPTGDNSWSVMSLRLAAALGQRLGDTISVGLAGLDDPKSIGVTISRLVDGKHCHRLLFAPLSPQSCADSAQAEDMLFAAFGELGAQPPFRILPPYFDDPLYIAALERNVGRQLAKIEFVPDRLLLSFTGTPDAASHSAVYYVQCLTTARLLRERLNLEVDAGFQVQPFGEEEWLVPSTAAMLAGYPGRGIQRIAIAAPGLPADCQVSLQGLGIGGRETFLAAGGTHFARLDCLNDSADGIGLLEALIRRKLAGWWPNS